MIYTAKVPNAQPRPPESPSPKAYPRTPSTSSFTVPTQTVDTQNPDRPQRLPGPAGPRPEGPRVARGLTSSSPTRGPGHALLRPPLPCRGPRRSSLLTPPPYTTSENPSARQAAASSPAFFRLGPSRATARGLRTEDTGLPGAGRALRLAARVHLQPERRLGRPRPRPGRLSTRPRALTSPQCSREAERVAHPLLRRAA